MQPAIQDYCSWPTWLLFDFRHIFQQLDYIFMDSLSTAGADSTCRDIEGCPFTAVINGQAIFYLTMQEVIGITNLVSATFTPSENQGI